MGSHFRGSLTDFWEGTKRKDVVDKGFSSVEMPAPGLGTLSCGQHSNTSAIRLSRLINLKHQRSFIVLCHSWALEPVLMTHSSACSCSISSQLKKNEWILFPPHFCYHTWGKVAFTHTSAMEMQKALGTPWTQPLIDLRGNCYLLYIAVIHFLLFGRFSGLCITFKESADKLPQA